MTKASAVVASDPPGAVPFPKGYQTKVLLLLTLGFTLNFMDRTIMAVIGIPIREEMHLTSTQLGLLNGLYFALTYVVLGIPVARIADRINRVGVIGLALCVWSGFTALCGMATNFTTLALCRFGVGVGEAGFSAPSHSLISDYYEPQKRASALSVFSFGVPLGGILGAILGGYLAEFFGWRTAFYALGLPGIVVGVLTWLYVKEPRRGSADAIATPTAPEASRVRSGLDAELRELGSVARALFLNWPMLNIMIGMTLVSFSGYGVFSFAAQYVYTQFGLSLGATDVLIGLVLGTSAGIGTLAGGFIADRLAKRSANWHALVPAIGLALCVPLYAIAYTVGDWRVMFTVIAVPAALHYVYMAPSFAVAQNAVPAHQRATVAALLLFVVNFIALGGGPIFSGALVDFYANVKYVEPAVESFWPAIGAALPHAIGEMSGAYLDLITFSSHTPLGADVFHAACPGGTAPDGAAPAAVEACNSALAWGSQQAILIGLGAYAWGALHYFLATIGLKELLRKRAGLRSGQL